MIFFFADFWKILNSLEMKYLDEAVKILMISSVLQAEWMAPEVLRNELSDEKYAVCPIWTEKNRYSFSPLDYV